MTVESTGQKDEEIGLTPYPGVEKVVVLRRKVEHLQCVEEEYTEDKDRYSYTSSLQWKECPVNSRDFHQGGHVNPLPRLPYVTESMLSVEKFHSRASLGFFSTRQLDVVS